MWGHTHTHSSFFYLLTHTVVKGLRYLHCRCLYRPSPPLMSYNVCVGVYALGFFQYMMLCIPGTVCADFEGETVCVWEVSFLFVSKYLCLCKYVCVCLLHMHAFSYRCVHNFASVHHHSGFYIKLSQCYQSADLVFWGFFWWVLKVFVQTASELRPFLNTVPHLQCLKINWTIR